MRYLGARVFSLTGIARLTRHLMTGDGRFVVLLHGIFKRHYPNLTPEAQAGLTVQDLDQIIRWVKRRFQLLTPSQFFDTDRPGVLLTFDDGHANTYANALPVLEQHDASAIFFISTQHVFEPRNWLPVTARRARTQWSNLNDVPDEWAWELFNGVTPEQLEAGARHPLMEIGSHTVSHPFLTQVDDTALIDEVVESRRQLQGITGQEVNYFSYPTGDYDRRVAEAVKAAGYRAAFAVDCRKAGLPLFEIPRVGIYSANSMYLDVKLSGLHRRPVPPGWLNGQSGRRG